MSRRARRMERHHKRSKKGGGINLVSLMDIFTILVFFLLVNSSQVEVLPNAKTIKLPKSVAEQKPKETLAIMVSNEDLLVQGRFVAKVADVLASDEMIIIPLKTELEYQAARSAVTAAKPRREITIVADKNIPYKLLKRIMVTSNSANYSNISLAVAKKLGKSD